MPENIPTQPSEDPPELDLAELLYDEEQYEEIPMERHEISRLRLSDEEWRRIVDEWGEEYP